MTKSQKPQEATNILIIDENMRKHRIEALEFPKLRQQDASTSLKSIFGQLEHHEISKQHARLKMASFTADGAAVNTGQHAGIKALILGDKCFIDQLNTARDFYLSLCPELLDC